MKTRVISASVLIVITICCMILPITRVLYLSAAALLCSFEMHGALTKAKIRHAPVVLYVYVIGSAVLCCLSVSDVYLFGWFVLAVFGALTWCIADTTIGAHGALATLAALVYPLFLFTVITRISRMEGWLAVFIIACLATWCCDSFALFGGKRFGKHKLAPAVSPNKTVEGTICGAVSSLVAGLVSYLILKYIHDVPLVTCLITSLVASSFGQIGDLAASLFKRMAGLKDYSNLIPGHGGMLDRADSLLFSIPTAFICLCLAGFFKV